MPGNETVKNTDEEVYGVIHRKHKRYTTDHPGRLGLERKKTIKKREL